jgi:hypothetical protein
MAKVEIKSKEAKMKAAMSGGKGKRKVRPEQGRGAPAHGSRTRQARDDAGKNTQTQSVRARTAATHLGAAATSSCAGACARRRAADGAPAC